MKIMISAMAAACMLSGGGASAQTATAQAPAPQAPAVPPPVAEVCAKAACRTALTDVVIRVDDARFRTIPVPQSPYLLDATSLLVFPGETLAIQFAVEGDKITGAKLLERLSPTMAAPLLLEKKVVANPEDAALRKVTPGDPKAELAGFPANVLLLSFGQQNGKPDTILKMQHNMGRNLKVDAIMAVFGPEGYVQRATSTCVLMPNVAGIEHWPHPMGPIILAKARLMPDSSDMSCS